MRNGVMNIWQRLKKWWLLDTPFALPLFPEEGEYSWKEWRADAKAGHPVRYFFQETLRSFVVVHVAMPVEEFFYWSRTHTYNRYHILDLRSPQNYYDWGWIDRDRAMLHACFNLLRDFVEKEMDRVCYYAPATENCPEWDRRDIEKEILELYQWWKKDRREHIDANPMYFHPLEGEECEDDVMLARLIKIRGYLWS